jgi:hypothetical protein
LAMRRFFGNMVDADDGFGDLDEKVGAEGFAALDCELERYCVR